MIPLRLTLLNFMCYRDNAPTLNLEGIHVACLCGANGSGKSALLDAIAWALWGESRAKSDDDLIHYGQSSMEVTLDFIAQGNKYRVIRKRSRGSPRRPGTTLLELQVPSGDDHRAITGNTVRDTQRKLLELLRMDYKTFTNSAFLVQGKADLFTTSTPAERKKVLAEILELSYYDELEQKAKDKARTAESERQRLGAEIESIKDELSHESEYQEELRSIQEALKSITTDLDAERQVLEGLRGELSVLETKRGRLSEVERDIGHYQQEIERLQTQISRDQQAKAKSQDLLAKSEEIRRDYTRLQDLRQEKERLDSLLPKFAALSQREQERSAKAAQLDELTQELTKVQEAITYLEAQEGELANEEENLQELNSVLQQKKAAQVQLRQEMEDLRDKINRLGEGDATMCPLCGTPLGLEGKERILAHYEEEGKTRKEKYLNIDKEVKEQDKELRKQRQELDSKKRLHSQELKRETARLATLQERIGESEKAKAELPHLLSQTGELKYDAVAHEQIRASFARLQPVEEQFWGLQQAEERLPQLQRSLSEGEASLEQWTRLLQERVQSKKAIEEEVKSLPEIRSKLASEEERNRELLSQRDDQTRRLGTVEAELERCLRQEVLLAEKERAWNRASEDMGIYEELTVAFGKKGIQALIIESALPELEEEANRLLSRLTDNRMQLKIESQRDTKKGDTVETLDIKISDELGTRNYELFSGGEAFRINFALRIALSRLLAHRAGAPLPTLFIDEGFGTQDAAGREKLIESINAIQNDFERILVITHIDELKEMFPARIEVTKTPEGSTFWIN